MNFIRGWRWEHFKFKLPPDLDTGGPYCVAPQPWARTGPGTAYDGGPRFDLDRFDQAYFDRLRARIIEAGDQNIYVSVMLFEGFCMHVCDDDTITAGHPFDRQNNINGIDIDAIDDYQSASVPASVLALQRAYLRKVIDTVQDLDNVLYEVANESWTGSVQWQYEVINYVKRYQTTLHYKKHPVGMSAIWPGGHDSDLYASPADWIMPGIFAPRFGVTSDYRNDPPAGTTTVTFTSPFATPGPVTLYLSKARALVGQQPTATWRTGPWTPCTPTSPCIGPSSESPGCWPSPRTPQGRGPAAATVGSAGG